MNETTAFDVSTAGEAMALFIARAPGALENVRDFHLASAGAELNVAIDLARLDLRAGFLSRVGDDVFGHFPMEALAGEGVSGAHVSISPQQSTGFMLKSLVTDGGDAEIDYYRRGSAASHLALADCPRGFCERARRQHLKGISPALSESMRELVSASPARRVPQVALSPSIPTCVRARGRQGTP
jgi:2-dehydro-3-deoxygluconokinase